MLQSSIERLSQTADAFHCLLSFVNAGVLMCGFVVSCFDSLRTSFFSERNPFIYRYDTAMRFLVEEV